MKKIISLFVVIAMLFSVLTPCVFSEETVSEQKENLENALFFTCTYDAEKKQVIIDGTVNHDIMVSHEDYTIKIYSILPEEDTSSVLSDNGDNALAESSMTVKFTFYIDIVDIRDRYSRYAVVFTSPDGTNNIAGNPQLPSISSEYSYDPNDRTRFKGILSTSSAYIGDSGAGTVVVDFRLDIAQGDISNSYLYPMVDKYVYIKKSYIAEIDKQIIAASLSDSRVYIRLLLDSASGGLSGQGKYSIPNLYSVDIQSYIFAVTEFLANRYDGTQGKIDGFIVGSKIDEDMLSLVEAMSLEDYADIYTLYLVVVGNAARAVNKSFDIVVPISDTADYMYDSYESGKISASLLESILKRLDNNVSGHFDCSVMIESDYIPKEISNSNINQGFDIKFEEDEGTINADNVGEYINYLGSLSENYDSAPKSILYMWSPSAELSGNALSCAFVYNYLKLRLNNGISAFITAFSDDNEENYKGLKKIFEYIDTDNCFEYINPLTRYFDENSWDNIIKDTVGGQSVRKVLDKEFYKVAPQNIIGEFCYIDFTSSSSFEMMKTGQNCASISTDYNATGIKALKLVSEASDMEAIGLFEFPENYVYTPYMSVGIEINDGQDNAASVYEILLTLGSKEKRINVSGVVSGGEQAILYFDMSEYSSLGMAEYIKISARCLTGDAKDFSLLLYDLKGYSDKYSSSELDELITALRQQIRNQANDEDKGFNRTILITIVTVVVSLIAVGIGLIMVFRRDEENNKN